MYPESIIKKFIDTFSAKPTITVRAPGRINLIGEHTDYNDGYVLPASIDKAIYFSISPRTDNECHVVAFDLDSATVFSVDNPVASEYSWCNYLIGVVDELQKAGKQFGGFNLVFGGDIPLGAGVSSSAAVETGLSFAINYIYELGLSTLQMVQISKAAENNFVGVNCGIMDQFASMFGKKDSVIRLDCRDLSYQYFPIALPEHAVVLCNTGVKHSLGDSEYNTRRLECEEALRLIAIQFPSIKSWRDVSFDMLAQVQASMTDVVYRRAKYVIGEIERVEVACEALSQYDLATFGQKMYETHHGLQHDYEVSCPELDFLVDQTKNNPAVIGSRMMGGGFGGCTVNIVEKTQLDALISQLTEAYQKEYNRELVYYVVALTNGTELV
ncbi:galactokinase [Flectobacillus longus]|uniref:galactokinase n=1 Tax=Flectobacillus longus TaxID=2984207 RepID=UPI0024B74D32|nr:galactokinase [Flectobacillus longus]MDI9879889.1 galactokinase [Flectobacillus longus]